MTWRPGQLKHWLSLNESGVWGEEPDGQNDVEVLRSTDISLGGQWKIVDPAVRSVPAIDRHRKVLREGDLVVVTSSGSEAHLGKTAIVSAPVAARSPCFANFVQRLRPTHDADARYIRYFLGSSQAKEELAALGNTTTGLRNLNGALIGSVTFPGPSLAEQRAIADHLDAETVRIDALIAKKQQLIHLLEERRRSVTLAEVTGRLTHPADLAPCELAWADEVPRHWDVALLRLVAEQGTGHTPSRDHPEWWIPDECVVPWVTTGEVRQVRSDRVRIVDETRERISHIGIQNSSAEVHPKDTVFLCRTAASAGYSGIMGSDMATSQDIATWTCGDRIDPDYLLFCLRAMRKDLLERLATGSTHKTIYMPEIQGLQVPVPPIDEQRETAERLKAEIDRSFAATDALTRQIELLAEHRQALITAAVTGVFAVPSAE